MKLAYYRTAKRFVSALVAAVIPSILLAAAGYGRGGVEGWSTLIVLIILTAFFSRFVLKRYRYPFLVIDVGGVYCETLMGDRYRVDPTDYALVVSNDWLGFRRTGDSDIAIGKHEFRDGEWEHAVEQLKSLPFVQLIEGTSSGSSKNCY